MLYDLVSQDVSLMQKSGERTTSVSIDSLVQKSGGTYNLVSIDILVQKSGGTYNLCEPSQAL
jgi:hypothetical protein